MADELCGFTAKAGLYGDMLKGVRNAYQCFQKAGVKDLSMKLYEGGRHEMLNEINRGEVYQDILNWLNQRV